MTSEQFTYWLQGFIEMTDSKTIDEKQTQIIKDHLKLVFTKVTPDYTAILSDLNKTPNYQVNTQPNYINPYPVIC